MVVQFRDWMTSWRPRSSMAAVGRPHQPALRESGKRESGKEVTGMADVHVDEGPREYEPWAYQPSEYRRLRYAWLYDDEDIWASPDPSLS
jgi:hypothetical protein